MSPPRMSAGALAGALALACALAAWPAPAWADPALPPGPRSEGPTLRLGWPEVRARLAAHPLIAAGRHETAAAQAAIDAAGAVANPSLSVSAAYGRARDGSAWAVEWGLGLSVPFDWIATRGPRVDAAGAGERLARASAEAQQRDLVQAVQALFWDLVYQQSRVAALAELGQRTAELSALVARRVDKGAARPVEATRVEVEAQKIAGELAAAELDLAARRTQLSAWLGLGPDRTVSVEADLADLPAPPPQAETLARVRKTHPRLAASAARVDARTAELELARRQRLPAASLDAFTDHELDRRAYGLGLSLSLPVWNFHAGDIRSAEASLAAARERRAAEGLALETAAIEARARCLAGIALATRYRDQVLPRAETVAGTIQKTYELGEATLLEVVDARRTLLDIHRQTLSTLVRAHLDCSRLDALIGEEEP